MAAGSLRPHILRVMSAQRERPLSTREIYEAVAQHGGGRLSTPGSKRDRNLVNRELSDLAGMSPESHSKPAPQLLARVGRGRYIFREPELPLDLALAREYLEPEEVYEKRDAAGADGQGPPGKGRPSRSGSRCLRCSGESALAAAYICPTTCASRWTTSWRWPTTAGPSSGTCSCSVPTATGLRGRGVRTGTG